MRRACPDGVAASAIDRNGYETAAEETIDANA
jgi:hypothetical protein